MTVVEIGKARSPYLLSIYLEEKRVCIGKRPVGLSWREFQALEYLAWCAGSFVSRSYIYKCMYRDAPANDDRMVDVLMSRINQKLSVETGGFEYIRAIRNEGYLLSDPLETLPRIKEIQASGICAQRNIRGRMVIDDILKTIRLGKEPLELSPREYEILSYMGRRTNCLIKTSEFFKDLWDNHEIAVGQKIVNVSIFRARAKLQKVPQSPYSIVTIRPRGYVLRGPTPKIITPLAA